MSTCEPSWSASATGVLIRSRPASSTRMVSLPAGLARFPVSGQEHARGVPAVLPHPLGHLRIVEVITGAPQPLPAHRDRWSPVASASSAAPSWARSSASRRVLANRSAALRYPRRRRGRPPAPACSASTRFSSPGRSAQRVANTAIAWRRSATCAANARIPNWYWSSTARVIAPAHRLDAAAVTERLRCPRHAACDSRSSRPRAARPAQLRAVQRTEMCPDRRQRCRLTLGHMNPGTDPHPRRRRGHHRITNRAHPTALTHTPHPDSHYRHRPTPTRALLTTARYHSLRLTIRPAVAKPVDHGGDARCITGRSRNQHRRITGVPSIRAHHQDEAGRARSAFAPMLATLGTPPSTGPELPQK